MAEIKIEVVACPKCPGKMVPLSGTVYEGVKLKAIPIAEWRCVKCGHKVSARDAR